MGYDDGLARLKQRFARIPVAIREKVAVATLEVANDLADQMRRLAPEDTGALKDSITVTPGGKRTPPHSQPGGEVMVPEGTAMVTAGNDEARYPHLVEWGTDDAEAQPFFFPAIRLGRKRAAAKLRRAIRKAARDA